MESFQGLIYRKRNEKSYSRRKLADLAGISHSEVHRLENGQRKSPSPTLLVSIAKALNIDVIEMFVSANYLEPDCVDQDSLCFLKIYNSLSSAEKIDVQKYVDFIKSKR